MLQTSTSQYSMRRPRVLDRLHEGVGNGLIVVQAPAGYGKSTALHTFAEEVDYHVAWVSLDATAAVPEALAGLIARAISGPDAAPPVSVLTAADLRGYITATLRAYAANDDRPLMFVFDNSQALARSVESADLLAWLFETLPDGYEFVVSGREPLPITPIDSRVAGGECLTLGPEDLAFDEEETAELLRLRDASISPGEAFRATNGWPIALAGIASGTVPLGEAGAVVARGSWDRYLAREVLAAVPDHLRTPLLQLSVLPVLDTAVANDLVGRPQWTELRRWLDEHGFLAEHVSRSAVRLNQSLQQFFRTQLVATVPEVAAETTRAVAARLARSGSIADAIQVAIDLDDPEVLREILEGQANALLLQGSIGLLRRAFELLGPTGIDPESPLNGIRLRVLVHSGFPEAALEQAGALLRHDDLPPETRFHALLAQVRAFQNLARGPELNRLFEESAESLAGADPIVVADYLFQKSQHAMHRQADYPEAERLLRACYELAEEAGALQLALMARSARGELLTLRGNPPAAVDELIRATNGWRRMGTFGNLCWTLNNLGMAHLAVGDFESAARVLEEARIEAVATENARIEAYAIASLGDCYIAQGNVELARKRYEEALRMSSEGVLDPTLTLFTLIGLSTCAIARGENSHADFLASRAVELALAMANDHNLALAQLQLAATHSIAGDHVTAEALATDSVENIAELDSPGSLRMAHYRLAMVQFAAGSRQKAEDTLLALDALVTEPWMVSGISPLIHENRMFAQWAASRPGLSSLLRDGIGREVIRHPDVELEEAPEGTFPVVTARSLGQLSVAVDGVPVPDSRWTSARAREMFFVFLANPNGLRKEQAVEVLFPDLEPARCNSAFHSNLYRLRGALYHDVVVREENMYRLNPEAEFDWDVTRFNDAIAAAQQLPAGSPERAKAYETAIAIYQGPFAAEFYGEWAESIRDQVDRQGLQTLSSLAGFYAGRGDFERAAAQLEQVIALSPYNEEAVHQLALNRARGGNAIAAIGAIDDFAARLDRDLGEPVPARLRELRSTITAGKAV